MGGATDDWVVPSKQFSFAVSNRHDQTPVRGIALAAIREFHLFLPTNGRGAIFFDDLKTGDVSIEYPENEYHIDRSSHYYYFNFFLLRFFRNNFYYNYYYHALS